MGINPPRTYSGYCFYRGSVAMNNLSAENVKQYKSNRDFWSVHDHGAILTYRIGIDEIMWGIYRNHTEAEMRDVLLDSKGHQHRVSLTKDMRPEILADLRVWSRRHFPPQLSNCTDQSVTTTVQAMSDCHSSQNSFLNGKVLLIGEASTLLRPHIVAGTDHAVYHAHRLKDLVEGRIDIDEWCQNTKAYSNVLEQCGKEQGDIWMKMDGDLEVVLESRRSRAKMVNCAEAIERSLRVILTKV